MPEETVTQKIRLKQKQPFLVLQIHLKKVLLEDLMFPQKQ